MKQIHEVNQKNMIKKSEYSTKYVFQERGVTVMLGEQPDGAITEIES